MTLGRGARYSALAIILLVALAWRLHNIGFGLPSLYDPDEPIFMIKALELLTNGTLNPKWFGHPGSTTIYLLALIDAAVVGSGSLPVRMRASMRSRRRRLTIPDFFSSPLALPWPCSACSPSG